MIGFPLVLYLFHSKPYKWYSSEEKKSFFAAILLNKKLPCGYMLIYLFLKKKNRNTSDTFVLVGALNKIHFDLNFR